MSVTCLLVCLLVAVPPSDPQAAVLVSQGRTAALSGEMERARELYGQALALYERADDLGGQGAVQVHLSDLALREDNASQAIDSRKQAYRLFQRAGLGYSQAKTLQQLGGLYVKAGDLTRATELLERAAPMFVFLKASQDAYATRMLLVELLVVDGQNWDFGRILKQARELISATDPPPALSLLAGAYHQLGTAYGYLGDYRGGADCYAKALELMNQRGTELDLELKEILQANRAFMRQYLGEYREAAQTHEQLLAQRSARGDLEKVLASTLNASVAWRYVGDLKRSEQLLDAVDKLMENVPEVPEVQFRVEMGRGRLAHLHGDFGVACNHFELCESLLGDLNQDVWRLRLFHAQALERSGDAKTAEAVLVKALTAIERDRVAAAEFRQRASVAESRGELFSLLVALRVARGQAREALATVEQHKARTFLDLLAGPPTATVGGAPPHTTLVLRAAELIGDDDTRGFGATLKAKAQTAAASPANSLATTLVKPDVALPPAQRPPEIEAVQQALRAGEGLLEYYLGRDESFMFLVTSDEVLSFKLPAGRERLGSLVRDWRHEIETERNRNAKDPPSDVEHALTNLLLGPVWPRIVDASFKTLYVVPDGPLHQAPLAALHAPNGELLIRRFALAHLPSASSLVPLAARPAMSRPWKRLLAVANPQNDLPPLPFAVQEAERASRLFSSTQTLAGAQATKADLLRALPQHDVALFALHGKLDPFSPTQSALYLAGPSDDPSSRWTVAEVARSQLGIRLAVLSACEPGWLAGAPAIPFGRRRGRTFAGVSAGRCADGCRHLVAVSDRAMANLVETLLTNLQRRGLSPSEALRQAQLSLLESPEHAAPYYWSGVCLYGVDH